MIIRLSGFQGVMPSIDATMLPDGAAQSAIDCKLGSGGIKPLHVALAVNTPSKVGTKSKIWLYDDAGTPYWLHWVGFDVDAVKSPLPNDSFKRVYWTGDGVPKMAPITDAVFGGTGYPVGSYSLGLPAPPAPSVLRVGTAGTDETLDESRAYVVRYVTAYGEVGPPSDASAIVTWSPGNTVTVTLPAAAPVGTYNVATLDIFRTNTGTSGTEYQYVASVTIGTASYSDAKENSTLGFVLDSTEYLAPNAGLKGLITLPFGSLAGFYDNVLCFSETYQPHAWPAGAQYSLADKIVSIASFGNSVLVTTTGFPYVVTGNTPTAMSVERFEEGYSCISKRGTVDMGYSVLYPTPLGLMSVGTNGAKLLTEGVCTVDEWKALKPETAHSYAYGGKYFAFTDAGAYAFNPADGTYVQLSATNLLGTVTAGHSDTSTGNLYLMAGANIVKFDGGVAYTPFVWKSKVFIAPYPLNMSVLQVFAAGSVTVKVYADGVLTSTSTITDSDPVRLPSGFRAVQWEVEITSSTPITQALMSTSMAELSQL